MHSVAQAQQDCADVVSWAGSDDRKYSRIRIGGRSTEELLVDGRHGNRDVVVCPSDITEDESATVLVSATPRSYASESFQ